MGYYVKIVKSNAYIPAANLQRAYKKMCALNVTHHSVKRGYRYSGGEKLAFWFSWMDENYPETCKDAQAVLEQLGFSTEYNDAGDLLLTGYDNKTGQEELFLKAIEEDGVGSIVWEGECDETWTTFFVGGTVIESSQ